MNATDKYYVIAKDLIKTKDFQQTLECWSSLSLIHTGKKVLVMEEVAKQLELESMEVCRVTTCEGFPLEMWSYTPEWMNFTVTKYGISGELTYNRYIQYENFIEFLENGDIPFYEVKNLDFRVEKLLSVNKQLHLWVTIKDLKTLVKVEDLSSFIENIKKVQRYA